MTRRISDAGLALVKKDEGLRLAAYQDVASVWTIGYGHTPARPGQKITEADAEDLLRHDIARFERAVDAVTQDVPTTEEQFSAMVSLAFNIGIGAFKGSSVLKKHRAKDYSGAAAAFLLWDKGHVEGQLEVIPGLLRRRNEERRMYLGDAAPRPQPAPAPAAPASRNIFTHILQSVSEFFGRRPARAPAKPAPAPAVTKPAAPRVGGTARPAQESPADNDNSAEALNAAELQRLGGVS